MCKKPPGTITPRGLRCGADSKLSFLLALIVPCPRRKGNKNMQQHALKRARMAYKGPRAAHGSLGHGHALQGVLGHEKSPALQIRAFLNRESSMTRGRLHLAVLLYHASREQVRLLRKLVFQPPAEHAERRLHSYAWVSFWGRRYGRSCPQVIQQCL